MKIIIQIPEYYQSSPIDTYSQEQLVQGIAQARHAHNLASGKNLTDTEWITFVLLENAGNWHRSYIGSVDVEPSPVSPPPADTGLATTLAPQFETKSLDLRLKKGESAPFSVAVTNYDLDLRGCLIFAEIRRTTPGYELINNFTGVAISGSNTIPIQRYPPTNDKAQLLKSLPVRVGDLITLEGSGISSSKVLAVTDSEITATASATRSMSGGRLLVRSLSLTSFTAIPYLPIVSVTATGTATAGATSINVANVTRTIPELTTLVFDDGGVAKIATLTTELTPGSTIAYVSPLEATITATAFAKVGAQTIITSINGSLNATSITTSALSVPMPSGTRLNFATRDADGWQYVGSATLTATVLAGAISIAVAALSVAIPQNAIAWFGTHPFNSFILAIDPADTQFLESGDYGYDVICRQADGYTIRIIQGNVKLTDHWSDGV